MGDNRAVVFVQEIIGRGGSICHGGGEMIAVEDDAKDFEEMSLGWVGEILLEIGFNGGRDWNKGF